MKTNYLIALIVCILLSMPFIALIIPRCNADPYTLTITYDECGWNSGMKRVAMTTQDIGLTFQITIYNNSTQPFDSYSNNFAIYIEVMQNSATQSGQSITIFSKAFSYDYNNELYLPSFKSYVFFVRVGSDLSESGNLAIGSYTATLSYSYGGSQGIGFEGIPIGLSPFDFRVESQASLNQAIQQSQGSSTFISIGPIQFDLFNFSFTVTIIPVGAGILGFLWKRWKKKAKT